MAEPRIYFPYRVEPFEEGFTGTLAWSTLGSLLLRISSLHAEAHGFGYTYMKEHHRGWVLSRLVFEAASLPTTGEAYTLSTWVSRIYRQFTDRLYTLQDADGKTVGYGHSTWALIDYHSRQPINLETLPNGSFYAALHDEDVPIAGVSRARLSASPPLLVHRAAFSDLDINGHVNSIRYITLLLDTFSKTWHEAHRVTRLEMSYGHESYAGDELRIYGEMLSDGRWAFEIRRPAPTVDGTTATDPAKELLVVRSVLTVAAR